MAQFFGRSIGSHVYDYNWNKVTDWKESGAKVKMLFSIDTSGYAEQKAAKEAGEKAKSRFRGMAVGINEETGELVYFGDSYHVENRWEELKQQFEQAYQVALLQAVLAQKGYKTSVRKVKQKEQEMLMVQGVI